MNDKTPLTPPTDRFAPMTPARAQELLDGVPRLLAYTMVDHGPARDPDAAAKGRMAYELTACMERPGGRFVDFPSVMGARLDSGIHPNHAHLLIAAPKLARAYLAVVSEQAATAGLSPEIFAFAQEMQRELDANARKGEPGSWVQCDPELLWNDVMYHAAKMIYAMKHGDADRVQEFAADVANMAMMTRDAWMHRRGQQP